MKKRSSVLILLLLGSALCWIFSGSAEAAGIVGTQHDMYNSGRGNDPNVCSYCHIPHNAAGIRIWSTWANEAELTNGPSSTIGNLCYTCHDGTVNTVGLTTVFNTNLQQHKVSNGKDCNMCHTVHDNTNGKFLGIQKTGGSGATESATYCQTCHTGATIHPDAVTLGDHLAGSEHPFKDSGNLLNDSCNSCHKVHGAAVYTTQSLTNPILRGVNTDSAFCATCHADHVQNVKDGNKHPANLLAAGTWGKVDCEGCHDVHQPNDAGRISILLGSNVDSEFCQTCHKATDTIKAPNVGNYKHPVNVPFTVSPTDPSKAPAANLIDDNNLNGPDYPSNTNSIVCESCHSVHLKGIDKPLVRETKDGGQLCKNCHANK